MTQVHDDITLGELRVEAEGPAGSRIYSMSVPGVERLVVVADSGTGSEPQWQRLRAFLASEGVIDEPPADPREIRPPA